MSMTDQIEISIREQLLNQAEKQVENITKNSTISNVKISVEAKTNE
jgi:hypothetical protein